MRRTLIALVVVLLFVPAIPAQDALKPKLPTTWKMPSLEDTARLKLLDLPGNLGDPLDLAIRSDAAELPKGAVIVAEAAADRLSWAVKAIDNPAAKAPRSVNLATITREGQTLFLAWSQPLATPVLRRQATNCLLDLRLGGSGAMKGTVQLREPTQQPTLVLDLMEERQTVEFELGDLPSQKTLRLEIRELSGFKKGTKVRDDSKSVGIGKRATIDVADLPGAEIRLLMQRLPDGGGLAVFLKSVFREKGAEFDLTLPGLENMVEAAQQSREQAFAALSAAKYAASDVEAKLNSLRSNPPTEIAQVNGWERSVAALVPQARIAAKQVQTMTNLIAECEARIKAAPKVEEALKNLNNSATIRFAICAESGDTDIVLAQAGDAVADVP